MSRVGQTLLPGHTLRHEGAPYAVLEDGRLRRMEQGNQGRALCSCGWLSRMEGSKGGRKRAHAAHKAELRGPDPSRVVGRLKAPLPAHNMHQLVHYLETAYGKDLAMQQDGDWFVFLTPEPTS